MLFRKVPNQGPDEQQNPCHLQCFLNSGGQVMNEAIASFLENQAIDRFQDDGSRKIDQTCPGESNTSGGWKLSKKLPEGK
ncbi:MAG: hypothetical protein VKN83_00705 [Cyanobacteriota bacterium]|nr:hypothetical protein [Cyanobacteriota bacterium]